MSAISIRNIEKVTPEQVFILSVIIVNGGNYLFNLLLGRMLGPVKFSDAAVLITLLLIFSFIGMTFQLVTAKFSASLEDGVVKYLIHYIYKKALWIGIIIGGCMIIFSGQLQILLNTSSYLMFVIFGAGVPIYFFMSVNRGFYQGGQNFKNLSLTYQSEMIVRLLFTLTIIYLLDFDSSILVAFGIFISLLAGLVPFKKRLFKFDTSSVKKCMSTRHLKKFFFITASYELTQIIINNSDILLVKHYFEAYEAGLYASLALIGRVVYFVAWMFVMLLLPTVVKLKKEGKETTHVLFKYLIYITGLASAIVLACLWFPELAINMLFGDSYLTMAPLLWKYALATGLFALSNIFAYYFLSIDDYLPVIFSGLFGLLQVGLVILYHNDLNEVVIMQVVAMVILLLVQLFYFYVKTQRDRNKKFNSSIKTF